MSGTPEALVTLASPVAQVSAISVPDGVASLVSLPGADVERTHVVGATPTLIYSPTAEVTKIPVPVVSEVVLLSVPEASVRIFLGQVENASMDVAGMSVLVANLARSTFLGLLNSIGSSSLSVALEKNMVGAVFQADGVSGVAIGAVLRGRTLLVDNADGNSTVVAGYFTMQRRADFASDGSSTVVLGDPDLAIGLIDDLNDYFVDSSGDVLVMG